MFRFADTKDKRAVSTQWGCAPLALVVFPDTTRPLKDDSSVAKDQLGLANASLNYPERLSSIYLNPLFVILRGLKKCPRNYLQALKAIPRTLRMMTLYSDGLARVSLDGRLVNADEASSA
ncbi:hypothetical protein ACE6H2_016125 [Prunus campanulata]